MDAQQVSKNTFNALTNWNYSYSADFNKYQSILEHASYQKWISQ